MGFRSSCLCVTVSRTVLSEGPLSLVSSVSPDTSALSSCRTDTSSSPEAPTPQIPPMWFPHWECAFSSLCLAKPQSKNKLQFCPCLSKTSPSPTKMTLPLPTTLRQTHKSSPWRIALYHLCSCLSFPPDSTKTMAVLSCFILLIFMVNTY